MNTNEICWLAGLLEGEGCFSLKSYKGGRYGYPRIQINMNDRDVIERVASMIGANVLGPYGCNRTDVANAQPYFAVCIQGKRAAEIMAMVRPYMMARRAAKIDEIIQLYKPIAP